MESTADYYQFTMILRRAADKFAASIESGLLDLLRAALDDGEFLTISEAAVFRGVQRSTIQDATRDGRLTLHHDLVSRTDLIKLRFPKRVCKTARLPDGRFQSSPSLPE